MRLSVLIIIGLWLFSGRAIAGVDSDACLKYIFSGDYQSAIDSGKEAVRKSPQEVAGHLNLGIAYGRKGMFKHALASLTNAEKLASDKDDLWAIANELGVAHLELGDKEQALGHFQRSLRLAEGLGLTESIGTALNNISQVYQESGDSDQALQYLMESLAYKSGTALAASYNNISGIYLAKGEIKKCIEYNRKAIDTAEFAGGYHEVAMYRLNLGDIFRRNEDYDGARAELEKGLAAIQKIGDLKWEAVALRYLGWLSLDTGNSLEARSYLERSMALSEKIGAASEAAATRSTLGKMH
jgi:tetratricopeptide (TPR) repeat protein